MIGNQLNQPPKHVKRLANDSLISQETTWATKKKPLQLSIESWLLNRDPYNGLLVGGFNPFETY